MTNFDQSKSVDDFASSTRHLGMNAQELLMECMKDEATSYSNRYGSYMTYFFCFLDPDTFTTAISDADITSFQKKVLDASMKYLSSLEGREATLQLDQVGEFSKDCGSVE